MLEVNPIKRISAKEALQHNFFQKFKKKESQNLDEEIGISNIEEFQKKKLKIDPQDNNSFVIRENVIDGKTDTVQDSDSKGGIFSFKNVNKNK